MEEAFAIARSSGPGQRVGILGSLKERIEAEINAALSQQLASSKLGVLTTKVIAVLRAKKKLRGKFWAVSVIGADGSEIYLTTIRGSGVVSELKAKARLTKAAGVPVQQQRLFLLGSDSDPAVSDTMHIHEASAEANVPQGGKIQFYLEKTGQIGCLILLPN